MPFLSFSSSTLEVSDLCLSVLPLFSDCGFHTQGKAGAVIPNVNRSIPKNRRLHSHVQQPPERPIHFAQGKGTSIADFESSGRLGLHNQGACNTQFRWTGFPPERRSKTLKITATLLGGSFMTREVDLQNVSTQFMSVRSGLLHQRVHRYRKSRQRTIRHRGMRQR